MTATPPSEDLSAGPYADAPAEVLAALSRHRASIDNIDNALIHLLAERFKHTGAVGVMKAEHDLAVSDQGREDAQALRVRALAERVGLDTEVAERFIRFLIDEVLTKHRALRK
ncbi:MAG: chorismate mutase [Pseudomonadota bacterium]